MYTIKAIKAINKSKSSFGNWAVHIVGIDQNGREFDGIIFTFKKSQAMTYKPGDIIRYK